MPPDVATDGITSAEGRLLAVQMGALRDDIKEVKDTMRGMAASLEKLVRIEEQQKDMRSAIDRAFGEIKETSGKLSGLEKRVAMIEQTMPGLRELRAWVIGGVIAGLGMIGSALVMYVQNHLR